MRKETKIAIVVILALLVVYAGVNYLKGVYIFSKPTVYYGLYEKINGLSPANPVVLNGYKIGQVKSIEMLKTGSNMLLVTMTIYEDIELSKDTKAVLRSSDLLGSMQIQIIPGRSGVPAQSGDTLTSDIEGDLVDEVNAQLRPIKAKAESLISSVDSVIKVVEAILNVQSQDNIVQSFSGINNAIASLERTAFQIDTIVQEERDRISAIFKNVQKLSSTMSDNSEELENIIKNFSAISDTLAKADLANTLLNANTAIMEVQEVVHKINSGEGSLGLLLNDKELYDRLESAAANMDLLMEDLRVNPNRYMHFSVFGRKNKNVELSRKELEELREYVNSNPEDD
jgi:phospholipid/cholesterol/gamma-HCH transport system substrate-binding protein